MTRIEVKNVNVVWLDILFPLESVDGIRGIRVPNFGKQGKHY